MVTAIRKSNDTGRSFGTKVAGIMSLMISPETCLHFLDEMHDACPNCGGSLHEVEKARRAEQRRRARWALAGLTLLGAGYTPHEGPEPPSVPKAAAVAKAPVREGV